MVKVLESPVETSQSHSFSRFIDAIRKRGIAENAALVTTLPRGGLRICRSNFLTNSRLSHYADELHQSDSAAWSSILKGSSTNGMSPIGDRMNFVLGVGIDSPVLPGFAGALLLFNPSSAIRKSFSELDEAQAVRELFYQHFGKASNSSRACSQIILSDARTITLPLGKESSFDETQMKSLIEIINSHTGELRAQRIAIKGARGVQTNVSITRYDSFRALGQGAKVFVSLYPTLEQWQQVTSEKVEGDPEMSRLIKAVHFITENFKSSPTLESIAESVGLSQFHFHRRFSEIFGVTPKHVLFDLQVEESKRQLAIDGKQLSEIASNCGFAHQSHFTCRFKQNTGITPTRWRVLHANG